MRIILAFVLGMVSAFYLTEFLVRLWKSCHFCPKIKHLHHSGLGLLLILTAVISYLSLSPILGASNNLLLSVFLFASGLGITIHHLLSESFLFSEKTERAFLKKHDSHLERILEILPGSLTWLALASPIWLSFIFPFAVAYIILLADIYWLVTGIRIGILTFLGYRKMEVAKKQDWWKKLQKDFPDEWQNYYHLFVLPTYTESIEVLTPPFEAIINSSYAKDKIFVGVGLEERDNPQKISQVQNYWQKNAAKLGGAFVTIHPYRLPGEIPGPATNRNWIITSAAKEFQKRGIKPEQVLVTTLDADFVVHSQFLAGALHKYLSTPKELRDKRSFTGAFLYHNNYWQCPAPMRLISTGTAFWQLSEMVGSDKYINFSSLTINMKSLLDIGLWIPDKVNDDSGFYWKAYYHFNGDYKVIPHYLPITADTVLDVNLVKTFENQYKQLQRWAYGVEHIPFIIKQYFLRKDINFWDKTDKLLFILWSYFKWGTLALFVTFAGLIIPFINPNYSQSVVAYNQPVISSWILTGAFFGLFATIYVHEKTAPKRPKEWSPLKKLWSYIQWALIPIILVTITSIPAIDAQTRLMLGKYLEFRVTRKERVLN